jgi:hypothetical protein
MEGHGAGPSIITVVNISAQIAGVVLKYSESVLSAREDAEPLEAEQKGLSTASTSLKQLLFENSGSSFEMFPRPRGRPEGLSRLASGSLREAQPRCQRKQHATVGSPSPEMALQCKEL